MMCGRTKLQVVTSSYILLQYAMDSSASESAEKGFGTLVPN